MSNGMLRFSSWLAGAFATAALFLTLVLPPLATADDSGGSNTARYIVVLKDSTKHPGAIAEDQAEEVDGDVSLVYRHALKGYAATLPKDEVQTLQEAPRVAYVVRDKKAKELSQEVPTGIERIGELGNKALQIDGKGNTEVNADVAVIDTGVDIENPDLNVV